MTKGVAMANKKLVDLLLQDENANVANDEFETLSGSDWVNTPMTLPLCASMVSARSFIMPVLLPPKTRVILCAAR